ncbi:uncharacterized protein LACBIDRAFT_323678 [Laccaria bicolor S238N-H82]|uniref:Predicted protein n=1 Tax=Laccaria bicolor (strain S238N-H82 / ATCC MYA-4686) TaxID=486041 RepID=B0CYF3_LACBS|nr:uncharacterized protein LACBIDRAFT_323678 [Laccaria bicolor S238N-H82]EDR12873.1 predicted protein [Laccaria bicolor S238N-H82]|eukprot:XP_001877137.1 predicted protein [Laccaria bicolor S238N-H82]
MLTSTKPRSTHTHTFTTPSSHSSPPSSPPRPTMHWLSRSSTQPSSPSKATRLSEPKVFRSIEVLSQSRTGVLGAGATVVRTPDEALKETGVRLTYQGKQKRAHPRPASPVKQPIAVSPSLADLSSSPNSPPLPPLPLSVAEGLDVFVDPQINHVPLDSSHSPPPAHVRSPSLRSSLKVKTSHTPDQVPPLPPSLVATSPPPPFRPILLSETPILPIDPTKVIVTLETCTVTYKTSLETINSRPSNLSKYIFSLLPHPPSSTTSSVYSDDSHDMAAYRHHLKSEGVLIQSSFNLHIFLDRSSAPYAHVLNYLRSPTGLPASIPRAAHGRLENLIELRDEAAYLGLDGLHKLCTDEIKLRHAPRLHSRGSSTGTTLASVHSLHGSVYSLHTPSERVEPDMAATFSQSSCKSPCDVLLPARSPPTPQSWEGPRSLPRQTPPAPAGWI